MSHVIRKKSEFLNSSSHPTQRRYILSKKNLEKTLKRTVLIFISVYIYIFFNECGSISIYSYVHICFFYMYLQKKVCMGPSPCENLRKNKGRDIKIGKKWSQTKYLFSGIVCSLTFWLFVINLVNQFMPFKFQMILQRLEWEKPLRSILWSGQEPDL